MSPAADCARIDRTHLITTSPPHLLTSSRPDLLLSLLGTLSYRRVELRIDAANARARKSAERAGFLLEGVLRKHRIVRSANRDAALYAMTNGDWRDGAEARLARLVKAPDQQSIAGPDARKKAGRSTL